VADFDMEDFCWTILLMDHFMKDDIEEYWVTYPVTTIQLERVTQVRALTIHTSYR